MTTELVHLSPEAEKADVFFGQKPLFTDWAFYLQNPAIINEAELVNEIGRKEPVAIGSPDRPRLFAIQQLLRIALRRNKKLPLVTDRTCSCCGQRKTDPALDTCLYCHEESFLLPPGILSSNSSEGMTILYDPSSERWGLQYKSGYRDDKYVMWAVKGFVTRMDARLATYPVVLFNQWVKRKTKGMAGIDVTDLITLDVLMAKMLPLNPDQFTALLREKISEQMDEKYNLFGGAINWALSEFDREHSR